MPADERTRRQGSEADSLIFLNVVSVSFVLLDVAEPLRSSFGLWNKLSWNESEINQSIYQDPSSI